MQNTSEARTRQNFEHFTPTQEKKQGQKLAQLVKQQYVVGLPGIVPMQP
jgi:hypothetical protein